jgi:hypothetical protein
MTLTNLQIYKLRGSIRLIEDILRIPKEYGSKGMITWLAVAEDYCREVKMEIKEALEDGAR